MFLSQIKGLHWIAMFIISISKVSKLVAYCKPCLNRLLSGKGCFPLIYKLLIAETDSLMVNQAVSCCDVCYNFCIKTMTGSFLPPVVCRRVHVLFMLFVLVCVLWCPTHIVLSFSFVCLRLVYTMLPFSLDLDHPFLYCSFG
jgi:hypothetical protein